MPSDQPIFQLPPQLWIVQVVRGALGPLARYASHQRFNSQERLMAQETESSAPFEERQRHRR